ncbi:MAG: hypothetical protein LLG44_03970 [Chloroflexi bacterium]|nr:hypothetical protein [Chloroflexota bacterium]
MLGIIDASLYGVKPSAQMDQTAALQRALDAAGAEGGVVELGAGQYLLAGSLRIPPGVCLRGINQAPQYAKSLHGTVLLATGGRGSENSSAFIDMGESSAAKGFTIYYPEQSIDDVHPYPWTFHLFSFDQTIENVTLVNSYNAIRCGPENNGRHILRNIYGTALRRGLLVDGCTDIGRVENVHWHSHWWSSLLRRGGQTDPVSTYMGKHCEAFIFARADWEYVLNTFVFPCKIGYRFIKSLAPGLTGQDSANGSFLGIGADLAQVAVQVDRIQFNGIAITNGEFAAFLGEHPTGVLIGPECIGTVRLENCSFWGDFAQVIVSHNQHVTSVHNCTLQTWGERYLQFPQIESDAGKLQVTGNTFTLAGVPQGETQIREMHEKQAGIDVRIQAGTRFALISENTGTHGVRVVNEIGNRAIIINNEPPEAEQYPHA